MERLTVILGVTGSIAAYKAAEVASTLHQRGHDVHVVMTEAATRLVTPATFHPLTGNPVHTDLWDPQAVRGGVRVEHVGLADKAHVFCVAPATANTIAEIANGLANDFLTTLLLAFPGRVLIAPAMNDNMYRHPAVRRNLETLRSFGYGIVDPEEGALACGRSGPGRLAEPLAIVEAIERAGRGARVVVAQPAGPAQPARRLRVLVSAGPTREALDDVRVLTNPSSGRMGDAIAAALAARGHDVVLVRGPVDRPPPGGVEVVPVETTDDMHRACLAAWERADAVVMAAAPCDWRPAARGAGKLKKEAAPADGLRVDLVRTPDILLDLGARKQPHQRLVGFALEVQDPLANALDKMRRKRLDLVVLNAPSNFGRSDGAEATLVRPDGSTEAVRGSKAELAARLALTVEALCAGDEAPAQLGEYAAAPPAAAREAGA